MRKNLISLSWSNEENRQKVSYSILARPSCSNDILVIEGPCCHSHVSSYQKKKTLPNYLLLPRAGPYPFSVKHYVNMINPALKSLLTAMVSVHPILSSSHLSIQVRLGWRPVLCRNGEAFSCAIDFCKGEYTVWMTMPSENVNGPSSETIRQPQCAWIREYVSTR